ncbi:MAG TPA: hydroxymethylglutaryl-CoA synthase [Kiritimatiellia bacterium]|nr:hydroxymethylglutaryl-CoA synthase [Kiritimatiellia bacterium]
MKTGIDLISFYSSRYYLDLRTLAEARGVDPDKFMIGIGQEKMAIPPPDEDIVTMAASAALPLLEKVDVSKIELLLFATESGVDQSKAGGIFVHGLLGLPKRCRVVELKEACYGGTAGLQMAQAMVARNPESLALVIGTDIARYDLGSPGEATQGCGAVAMIVSANPRLIELDPECGMYTEDVMDFWRPNYRDQAVVDGKYSTRVYLSALAETWRQYAETTGRGLDDFARFCFHLPFTRIAEKAMEKLGRACGAKLSAEEIEAKIGESLRYNRISGNSYSASLYVGLCSLLDTCEEDLSGKRIGLYSYGSGCVAEMFSGVVRPGYREVIRAHEHQGLLEERTELTFRQYEDIFTLEFPTDGGDHRFAIYQTGPFRLAGVSQHKRLYERVGAGG